MSTRLDSAHGTEASRRGGSPGGDATVADRLAAGADAIDLVASVADLHPKNDTFPGEVRMELAADALEVAGAGRDDPIPYEGLRKTHLPECEFRGRENRRFRYAILTSASVRGGLQPDPLDGVIW